MPHIMTKNIKDILLKVLKGLTEIGFIMMSITAGGHCTNLSFHNLLEDGLHSGCIKKTYSSDAGAYSRFVILEFRADS